MARRRFRYRTYIIKLWLAAMFCPPLAFLLFTFIIDAGMHNDPDQPLLLALFLFIAFVFGVPTVLFIIIVSFIIPNISKKATTLKLVTIATLLLGVLATFLWVLQGDPYSDEQVLWGVTSTLLYAAATIGFGWKFKL